MDFLHRIVGIVDPEDTGEPPEDWLYYFEFSPIAGAGEETFPCGSKGDPIGPGDATHFATSLTFGPGGQYGEFQSLRIAERLPGGAVGMQGNTIGPGTITTDTSSSFASFSGQEWGTRLFGTATFQFRADATPTGTGLQLKAYSRTTSGSLECRWWPIPPGFLATLAKSAGAEAEMGSHSWEMGGSTFTMSTPTGPRNFVFHSVGPVTQQGTAGGSIIVWMQEI